MNPIKTDKYSTINGEKLYDGNFIPENKKLPPSKDSLIFGYFNDELLLVNDKIPTFDTLNLNNIQPRDFLSIGQIGGITCHILKIDDDVNLNGEVNFIGLRQAYSILAEDQLKAAILGFQLFTWNRKTKYCGACGSETNFGESEDWVKKCPNCHESFFPKISPAIIVAISHKGKLLMAHHKRMASGIYTILAGFVNPGESLEECIHREVFEEAGIKVKNIKYFASQPWPFPDSLMVGFKAEYNGGELQPELNEITDLKWFAPTEIPEWPNRSSIARALIDDFISS